ALTFTFIFIVGLGHDAFGQGRARTLLTCSALGNPVRAPAYTLIERPSLHRGLEMEMVLLKSSRNPYMPDLEFPLVMTGLQIYSGKDGVVVRINRGAKGAGLIYLDYRRRVSQFILQGLQVWGEKGIEIWDTGSYEYTCARD
ncbi:MAG: hypothetical protein ABL958_20235, partial [Bdellovibrionia bacterium]